jgi:hypothetical protein
VSESSQREVIEQAQRPLGPLLILVLLLALAGCSTAEPTSVEPGSGPANTAGPVEGEPSSGAASMTGSFHDKIVYPDGVAVEVTKIRHAKLTDAGVGDKGQKTGDPIQVLSIRVTNGSNQPVQVDAASGTMTYGPDGDEASTAFDSGIDGMQGKVLPGRAKTGTYGYAVPAKYLGDVQLEFAFDFDHAPVVFRGSIK